MIKVKSFSKSAALSLLLMSWSQTSYASHIHRGEFDSLPDIDLRTMKRFPKKEVNEENSHALHERHEYNSRHKSSYENKPVKPEFREHIYKKDPEASTLFSTQYLHSLKKAEVFKDTAQTFEDKQLARQKIKTAVQEMKEAISNFYQKNQYEEASYIWNTILNSRYYEKTAEDQQNALYSFYKAEKYLSSIKLVQNLIDQKHARDSDLETLLLSFNNSPASIVEPMKKNLPTILYACEKIYNERHSMINGDQNVSKTLTKVRNIYPDYWKSNVITNSYWNHLLNPTVKREVSLHNVSGSSDRKKEMSSADTQSSKHKFLKNTDSQSNSSFSDHTY